MDPVTTVTTGNDIFSIVMTPLKWARRKLLGLEKIENLEKRIHALEEENSAIKSQITEKQNPLPVDATFLPQFGVWFSKSDGLYYCASCLTKKLRSPMRVERNGWRCLVKECEIWIWKENPNHPDVASFDLEGPAY